MSDLGLKDSKTLPWFSLGARLGQSWRLEFEYFKLDRSASRVLTREIRFEDTVYPITTAVQTEFDSSVYRGSVGYSFVRTQQSEFGVSIGAHVTDFRVALRGQTTGVGLVLNASEDQRIPLPTVGLYATYAITPNIELAARADVFKLKIRDYDGRLVNLDANVVFRFTRDIGVGVGYRYDDYLLKAEDSNFRGRLECTFRDPQVFIDIGL